MSSPGWAFWPFVAGVLSGTFIVAPLLAYTFYRIFEDWWTDKTRLNRSTRAFGEPDLLPAEKEVVEIQESLDHVGVFDHESDPILAHQLEKET